MLTVPFHTPLKIYVILQFFLRRIILCFFKFSSKIDHYCQNKIWPYNFLHEEKLQKLDREDHLFFYQKMLNMKKLSFWLPP